MSYRYGDSQADRDAYDRWATREPDRGDEGDLDEGADDAPVAGEAPAADVELAELLAGASSAVRVAMREPDLGDAAQASTAAASVYLAWVRDLRAGDDHELAAWAVSKLQAWALDAVVLDVPAAREIAALVRRG